MKTKLTTGKVSSNEDGAKAGRVDLNLPEGEGVYPEPFDAIFMSGWCWPPESGDTVAGFVPDGDDQVEFADDVKYLGVVYDQENPVDDEFSDDYPKARGFKTKAGHVFKVNDKSGSEEVKLLEGKSGGFVSMTGLGEIKVSNGKATITLSPAGAITLAPGSPLELAGNTDALLKGTAFNTDLSTYLTAQEALADANVTQFTALAAASTGPLLPLATAFTALSNAWTTYKAAITAFKNAAPNWLSQKSKTG